MTTDQHIAAARAAAATIQHPWDQQALDWPLTPESVVVEVGGYIGRWAYQIAGRFNPQLYVFEPQLWAATVCTTILSPFNATVLPYGLGTRDETLPMGDYETDGASFCKLGDYAGALRETAPALAMLGINAIDLMLINIEGYEYTLLPYMLDRRILPQALMVQWHTFADPDGTKERAIRKRLARHYTIAWDYGAVLTAWRKR